MMHTYRNTSFSESDFTFSSIPLLDDAFDPDDIEIFDHNEMFPVRTAEQEEEFIEELIV